MKFCDFCWAVLKYTVMFLAILILAPVAWTLFLAVFPFVGIIGGIRNKAKNR